MGSRIRGFLREMTERKGGGDELMRRFGVLHWQLMPELHFIPVCKATPPQLSDALSKTSLNPNSEVNNCLNTVGTS